MSMVEKLAYRKRITGLTSEEIAHRSGVPLGTVTKIFSGQTRHPSPLALDHICRVLRVSIRYLLDDTVPVDAHIDTFCEEEGVRMISEEESELLLHYRMLTDHGRRGLEAMLELLLQQSPSPCPVGPWKTLVCYQPIAHGYVGSYGDRIDFRPLQAHVDTVVENADFAVYLADQGMSPAYPPGSVLAVKREPAVRNQLGLFLFKQELLVRKFYRRQDKVKLVAVNKSYKDIHLGEGDECKCLGTILGAVKNYHWV